MTDSYTVKIECVERCKRCDGGQRFGEYAKSRSLPSLDICILFLEELNDKKKDYVCDACLTRDKVAAKKAYSNGWASVFVRYNWKQLEYYVAYESDEINKFKPLEPGVYQALLPSGIVEPVNIVAKYRERGYGVDAYNEKYLCVKKTVEGVDLFCEVNESGIKLQHSYNET